MSINENYLLFDVEDENGSISKKNDLVGSGNSKDDDRNNNHKDSHEGGRVSEDNDSDRK
jgi:hypothetical protein